jgi:hypothetical protein
MSLRSKHLRIVGAAGAAALTVGALSAPALSAPGDLTAHVAYSCFNGGVNATGDFAVAPPSTTSHVAGQKVKPSAAMTMTLPPGATHLLLVTLGWDSFKGTVHQKAPDKHLGLDLNVPMTDVGTPQGTDGTPTPAEATGDAILDYPAAGTFTLQAGNFTATLQGFKNGSKVGDPVDVACVAPTDGTTVLKDSSDASTTITVVKDKSKTATTAKYAAKKHKASGTAKVKGAKFGLPGTGKVKFTLKKGTKTLASKSGKLNKKGVASVSFKNISKKGKYSISAKFGGDKGLKGSSGKDTFKI